MGIFKRRGKGGSSLGGSPPTAPADYRAIQAAALPEEMRATFLRHTEGVDVGPAPPPDTPDRFAESLAGLSAAPPPPEGKLRGLARITDREQIMFVDESGSERPTNRYKNVVAEIHVPGRTPYEIRDRRLTIRTQDVSGTGYPVFVDIGDPDDVEFLFDEMQSTTDSAMQRIDDVMSPRIAEAQAELANPSMPPDIEAQVVESLRAIEDPELRARVIAQYRDSGIALPDDLV